MEKFDASESTATNRTFYDHKKKLPGYTLRSSDYWSSGFAWRPQSDSIRALEASRHLRRCNPIREDRHRHGWTRAHLPWRHRAVWHGAAQSRHLQPGLGLVFGLPLLRQVHDGV